MRAEAWRPNGAPTKDIVTIVESAVECAMGGNTAHRVRFAVDGFGNIKEMFAPCPDDPILIDAVTRLGGKCCTQVMLELRDYALGKGGTNSRDIPVPLDGLLDAIKRHIYSTQNNREEEHETLDPMVGRSPSTKGCELDRTAARLNATRIMEDGCDRILRRMRNVTGLERLTLKLKYTEEEGNEWQLHCENLFIGSRKWNHRGWEFDAVRLHKYIPSMKETFMRHKEKNAEQRRKSRRSMSNAAFNDYCIACRKHNPNIRTHQKTQGHADKACLLFYKAMKMFPGPKKASKS